MNKTRLIRNGTYIKYFIETKLFRYQLTFSKTFENFFFFFVIIFDLFIKKVAKHTNNIFYVINFKINFGTEFLK